MKQEKRRPWKRVASGFLAFAMTLSFLPPPVTANAETLNDLSVDVVGQQTLSTEFGSEGGMVSFQTLAEPETLPPIEGMTPSEDGDWELDPEDTGHWASDYLDRMVDYGYMRPEQAENPDEPLTRAEFMAIVNRAYNYTRLGDNPFNDVIEDDWYYEDVLIANNSGFITGTSDTTASPDANLTRETTAYILGKNMMLPEMSGENMDFVDADVISAWSRGMVKSTSHYGLINGYSDGTFRANDYITRAEIAVLVLQAIGTPVQVAGDIELDEVWGNVTITEPGTTLKNTIIAGDLYISNGIGLGAVTLENVTVLGRIVVSGGESHQGEASIVLRNVVSSQLIVDNMDNQLVTLRIEGDTYIANTYVRTNAYLEDNTTAENGLRTIWIDADGGTTIDFAGRVKEVNNVSPNTSIRVVDGTVDVMNIDELATEVMTEILSGAVVKQLNIDVSTNVTGDGDVGSVNVNASDVVIEMLPDNIVIRPGVDATINGELMNSTTAEEFSSEPRILAGYPLASDIAPTSFSAVFATNKPGTIYWGVSSITQGSISEDDLISPPSYGNIAMAYGSLEVLEAESEVLQYVEELQLGGSYYLSAILVDSRGDRSPVKVTAFQTPDDSIPEFSEGYPYMSSVTHNTAQVTVMATKTCKLYYAVLPAGSVQPTPAEFLAGAISGAEGSGIQDLTKNKDATFTVSNSLQEVKDYVLFLWLTDADGVNYSEVTFLEFTTKDGTPPEFIQVPTATSIGVSDVTFTFSVNEAATVYWVAVVSGTNYPSVAPSDTSGNITEPLNSEYAKFQVAHGIGAGIDYQAGNMTVNGNETNTFTLKGLSTETSYDLYYVAKDTSDNYSDYVGMVTFNTLDNTPPEFLYQDFTDHNGVYNDEGRPIQPFASTDVKLVFSESIESTYFTGYSGQSFLQLYTAIQTATTSDAETTARNNLAEALENSIKLYTWNGNSSTAVVERNADNENEPSIRDDNDWVIDYRYATVELSNGLMYISFPTITGNNYAESALNLSSGVTYGFKLSSIQDASYDSNVMVPAEVTVDRFTTIFGEVLFGPASVMAALPEKRGDDGKPTGSYATLDEDLRITPSNMTNVEDDIVYDIRLEPNKQVSMNIYYRIVDDKGNYQSYFYNDDDPFDQEYYPTFPNLSYLDNYDERIDYVYECWTPDDNGWILLNMDNVQTAQTSTLASIQGDGLGMGVGFNFWFLGYQGTTLYPSLNRLGEEYQIEMMFEITAFEGSTTRGEWNGVLDIDAKMYAGNYTYIKALGPHGEVDSSTYQNISLVSSPSDYKVSVSFTDSIPPEMGPGSPMARPEDITAQIEVSFDGTRTGTLYYAVVKSTSPSNLGPKDSVGVSVTNEQIPDINEYFFYLDPVNSDPDKWPNPKPPELSTPTYLGVTTYVDRTNASMSGSIEDMDKTSQLITVSGLEPLTTYYVYLVTKSDQGGGYSSPLLYQFTTEATQKPKYTSIVPDPSTGDVTFKTHVDSEVDYLILTTSQVTIHLNWMNNSFYQYLIDNDGGEFTTVPKNDNSTEFYTFLELYEMSSYGKADMLADPENRISILDMLSTEYAKTGSEYSHPDYSSGYTAFDVFATDNLKKYTYEQIIAVSNNYVAKNLNPVNTKAEEGTVAKQGSSYSDPDFQYVFFVMGKNQNAESDAAIAETHSFRARTGISIIDDVGPLLESSTMVISKNNSTTTAELPTEFTGTFSLTFDKYVYASAGADTQFIKQHPDNPSEDFWPGSVIEFDDIWGYSVAGPDGTIDYFVPTSANISTKGFMFDFANIEPGSVIYIFQSPQYFLSNISGYQHGSGNPNNLVLYFKSETVKTSVNNTDANGNIISTTATDTMYVWWETNWDSDFLSASDYITVNNSKVPIGRHEIYTATQTFANDITLTASPATFSSLVAGTTAVSTISSNYSGGTYAIKNTTGLNAGEAVINQSTGVLSITPVVTSTGGDFTVIVQYTSAANTTETIEVTGTVVVNSDLAKIEVLQSTSGTLDTTTAAGEMTLTLEKGATSGVVTLKGYTALGATANIGALTLVSDADATIASSSNGTTSELTITPKKETGSITFKDSSGVIVVTINFVATATLSLEFNSLSFNYGETGSKTSKVTVKPSYVEGDLDVNSSDGTLVTCTISDTGEVAITPTTDTVVGTTTVTVTFTTKETNTTVTEDITVIVGVSTMDIATYALTSSVGTVSYDKTTEEYTIMVPAGTSTSQMSLRVEGKNSGGGTVPLKNALKVQFLEGTGKATTSSSASSSSSKSLTLTTYASTTQVEIMVDDVPLIVNVVVPVTFTTDALSLSVGESKTIVPTTSQTTLSLNTNWDLSTVRGTAYTDGYVSVSTDASGNLVVKALKETTRAQTLTVYDAYSNVPMNVSITVG